MNMQLLHSAIQSVPGLPHDGEIPGHAWFLLYGTKTIFGLMQLLLCVIYIIWIGKFPNCFCGKDALQID
jgi:hypothetical protein